MNKILILFLLFFTASASHAEVFKCVANSGRTIYQNDPCPTSTQASTVQIEEIDINTVRIAQERLTLELQAQAEQEAVSAREALIQREIEAIERNTLANEDIAQSQRIQAQAQYQTQNQDYSSNQYYPYYSYHPSHYDSHSDRDRRHDRRGPDTPVNEPPHKAREPGKMKIKIK